jgi:hypothetical protein
MFRTKLIAFASALSCLFTATVHAQTNQPVAFIGDNLIYDWSNQLDFQQHSNWKAYVTVDQDQPQPGPGGALHGSGVALTALTNIIKSGQKPVIFFEAGEEDMAAITPNFTYDQIMAEWAANVIQIIKMAQTAKLPIIVATIPYTYWGDRNPFNNWLMTYAARVKVPVVNFDWVLNHPPTITVEGNPQDADDVNYFGCGEGCGSDPRVIIPYDRLTVTGYDLITDMAETQIGLSEGAFHLTGGYLGTIANESNQYVEPTNYLGAYSSVNRVTDGSALQFMAYGQYSDGSVRIINNADINGHYGTWTSSNPNAIFIGQNGLASALEPGTSNIHFTTLSGVTINEWTMYVQENYAINF